MASNKYEVEYSRSGRSQCKRCKKIIDPRVLRTGKVFPSPFHDGEQTDWFHPECLFESMKKMRPTSKKIEHLEDVKGISEIKDEDKKKIEHLYQEYKASLPVERSLSSEAAETGSKSAGKKSHKGDEMEETEPAAAKKATEKKRHPETVFTPLPIASISTGQLLEQKCQTEKKIETEDEPLQKKSKKALDGQVFCLAGKFSVGRRELEKSIEEHGGRVASSISKKVTCLLVGPGQENTLKYRKALSLPTSIINENKFKEMTS